MSKFNMRLINVDTYALEEFADKDKVPYAILSHRWEHEEVLYEHMAPRGQFQHLMKSQHAWPKVENCCLRAKMNNYQYVWIDTCCINKESSAELQEAINSMFRWYAKAGVCYAYLSDVTGRDRGSGRQYELRQSQWFSRGWTLQELLAPDNVEFFDTEWNTIGTRRELADVIEAITGVNRRYLGRALQRVRCRGSRVPCAATIMSWASGRQTTKIEDQAYSLMGLLEINMPLLYGEGNNAFRRLQESILAQNGDVSLLMWSSTDEDNSDLLAQSTSDFNNQPWDDADLCMSSNTNVLISATEVSLTCWLAAVCPGLYAVDLLQYNRGGEQFVAGIYLHQFDSSTSAKRVMCHGEATFTWHYTRFQAFQHYRTIQILRQDALPKSLGFASRVPDVIFHQHGHPSRFFGHYITLQGSPIAMGSFECIRSRTTPGVFCSTTISIGNRAGIFESMGLDISFDDNFAVACMMEIEPKEQSKTTELPGFSAETRNVGIQDSSNFESCLPSDLNISSDIIVLGQVGGSFRLSTAGSASFTQQQYAYNRWMYIACPSDCRVLLQIGGSEGSIILLQIEFLQVIDGTRDRPLLCIDLSVYKDLEHYKSCDFESTRDQRQWFLLQEAEKILDICRESTGVISDMDVICSRENVRVYDLISKKIEQQTRPVPGSMYTT